MKVAIRVDASAQIGTGHLMRCLTLAEAHRDKGALVVFICREHPGHLCKLVETKGFEVIRLATSADNESNLQDEEPNLAHAHWLGTSQSVDAEQTIQVLKDKAPWDWLVVDHYALDHRWKSAMRRVANKIMVIDDLAERKHGCDLLLDQSYFQEPEKRYQGLLPDKCQVLLGPRYALLRQEFREARKFCRMRGNGIARVMVYFGGNDPDNLTGMALEALSDKKLSHLLVDAVIGPNNPHQDKLDMQAKQSPGTRLHVQPEGFTELMLRADLCVGAGGTTTWERLCLSLPSLVITVAENQESFTAELHQDGLITWVGRKQDVSVADIKSCVQAAIDKSQANDLFSNSLLHVDGLGAMRVAEKIIPASRDDLSLRQACREDIDLLYFWANDPSVRENSFQQERITWDEHEAWFKSRLDSTLTEIWIMQTPYVLPVGQVRFDFDGETANISYSLDPVARGRGWGVKLVELGINKIKESGKVKMIQGKVKKSNPASKKVFLKLGFSETVRNDAFTFRKTIQ